ncbi:ATP-binding protein, partial [Escherichia coli]|nr:ATP-binding protein [Escherichia coli]
KAGPLFDTDNPAIDSNTISSGEDNIFIIIKALVSLRYYFESLIQSTDQKESILLIDEFDATLHPSLQIRLLDKIYQYAKDYKIQVFFTTHSLTLLEYAF